MAEYPIYLVWGLAGIFRRLPTRTFYLYDLDRSFIVSPADRRAVFRPEPMPIEVRATLGEYPRAPRIYERFLAHLAKAEAEARVLWIKDRRFALSEIDGLFARHGLPGLLDLYKKAAEDKARMSPLEFKRVYGGFNPQKTGNVPLQHALNRLWPERFTLIS